MCTYDGYGRVVTEEDTVDIFDEIARSMFELADRNLESLVRYIIFKENVYETAESLISAMLPSEYKKGMRCEDLDTSKSAEGQGHWFSSYETRLR